MKEEDKALQAKADPSVEASPEEVKVQIKELELPKIPENLSLENLREIYKLTQDQVELALRYVLTSYNEHKKEKEEELAGTQRILAGLNDHIVAVERALSKEESRLASLKFQEQGREKSMKHLEEAIKDMGKQIEEALEKQKEYEEEQSYNRATQMKLLQNFDIKTFKRIKEGISDTKGDPTLRDTATLFVALLHLKPTATDAEIKDAFSDYKKLMALMQDPKLETISSVDEKEYFKVQEGLSSKLTQFGNEKTAQERKELCNLMLHYVVFTIGISMAKRNLGRAIGRLEKMQKEYIDKEAEYAKKAIHIVDPEQIKLSETAVISYKNALNLLYGQREILDQKVVILKKELVIIGQNYFNGVPTGASMDEIAKICAQGSLEK